MTNINVNETAVVAETKKVTQREALTSAIECGALSAEVVEKLKAMVAQLDKKSSTKSDKPTKTQEANTKLKDHIEEFISNGKADGYTVSELLKADEVLIEGEYTNQKISRMLKELYESGKIAKEVIKGKSYFKAI